MKKPNEKHLPFEDKRFLKELKESTKYLNSKEHKKAETAAMNTICNHVLKQLNIT